MSLPRTGRRINFKFRQKHGGHTQLPWVKGCLWSYISGMFELRTDINWGNVTQLQSPRILPLLTGPGITCYASQVLFFT